MLRWAIVMQTVVVAADGRGDGVTSGGGSGAWLDAVTFGATGSVGSKSQEPHFEHGSEC